MADKIAKPESEWRKQLTPLQFAVTREKATERPHTGEYDKTTTPGTYRVDVTAKALGFATTAPILLTVSDQ